MACHFGYKTEQYLAFFSKFLIAIHHINKKNNYDSDELYNRNQARHPFTHEIN